MNTITVAQQILKQIGGEALALLGASNLSAHKNSFSFKIQGSDKVNHIKVTLDHATDTYIVEFFKFEGGDLISQQEFKGIYVDMLHDLIEEETGLYVSLKPRSLS